MLPEHTISVPMYSHVLYVSALPYKAKNIYQIRHRTEGISCFLYSPTRSGATRAGEPSRAVGEISAYLILQSNRRYTSSMHAGITTQPGILYGITEK